MGWIPEDVQTVLEALTAAGHEAWCVGGCVRDLLRGGTPEDWDVTTSALPEETMALFGSRAIPTGLQHGTLTVRTERRSVEVTTYRIDGGYADHRHPNGVTFTRSLEEDLARRDFTINAMALGRDGVIRDPFHGRADLSAGILRCVGEPDRRFQEDALRILRGLRFAAVLDFSLEPAAAESIHRNRLLLREIAAERIRVELVKLLQGQAVARVLLEFPDVLGVFMPEILPMVGFDQRNPHHCYDIWEHTVRSVEAVEADEVLRMTMLLHDIGKPACFTMDEAGIGHFYGHPKVSREIAAELLNRLRFSNDQRRTILTLVEHHDRMLPKTEKGMRRALRALGEENLRRLLTVKRADRMGQAPVFQEEGRRETQRAEELLELLLRREDCFSLKQLAINGRDLLELGLNGPAVGQTLDALLDQVIEGTLPNDRQRLIEAVAAMGKQGYQES
jgi:tRNA nucleotidyltransferase (CCA-adding enzyme)